MGYDDTAYKIMDALKSKLKTQGFVCIDSKVDNITTHFGKTLSYFYCSYPKLNVSVVNQNRIFSKTALTMFNNYGIQCKFDAVEFHGREQLVFAFDLDDQPEKDESIYSIIYDINAGVVVLAI